jgi:O-antigen/teichoic acid export membrane protein
MALNQRIMLFALGMIASSAELGRFAASHTVVSQAGFLATAIVLAYLPTLAKTLSSGDNLRFAELVQRKLTTVTTLMASFCLLGILLSPVAKQILYGRNFNGASELMILLWPGLFLWSASVAMRYILTLRSKPWHDLVASLVGVVFALVTLSGLHAMLKATDLPLLAAVAWSLGLLIECAIKTWALAHDGVLQLTSVWLLAGAFIGLVVTAVAYGAMINTWFPGLA